MWYACATSCVNGVLDVCRDTMQYLDRAGQGSGVSKWPSSAFGGACCSPGATPSSSSAAPPPCDLLKFRHTLTLIPGQWGFVSAMLLMLLPTSCMAQVLSQGSIAGLCVERVKCQHNN